VLRAHVTDQAQLDAIYDILHGWCVALFGDGQLDPVLPTING